MADLLSAEADNSTTTMSYPVWNSDPLLGTCPFCSEKLLCSLGKDGYFVTILHGKEHLSYEEKWNFPISFPRPKLGVPPHHMVYDIILWLGHIHNLASSGGKAIG